MKDSSYVVPESVRARIVKRPPDAPFVIPAGFPGIDLRQREETPSGNVGVYSTAKDLAIFGQMFLNGGSLQTGAILSRPAVATMTRNQIPGIAAQSSGSTTRKHRTGTAGSSKRMRSGNTGTARCRRLDFRPWGSGGCSMWVDGVNEIVGVYFEVTMRVTELTNTAGTTTSSKMSSLRRSRTEQVSTGGGGRERVDLGRQNLILAAETRRALDTLLHLDDH